MADFRDVAEQVQRQLNAIVQGLLDLSEGRPVESWVAHLVLGTRPGDRWQTVEARWSMYARRHGPKGTRPHAELYRLGEAAYAVLHS